MRILCLIILAFYITICAKMFLQDKNKIISTFMLLSFILFFIQIYFN